MKFLSLLLILSFGLAAQVSTGSVYGRITDQSGAVVADASITAISEATGFSRRVTADGSGDYRLDDLPPGVYSLTAERHGFQLFTERHARLEVNQQLRVDVELKVGVATESVEVIAKETLLQADDSSAGYLVDSQIADSLPLDGRDVMSLVTLGPGVVPRQLGGFVHDVNNDVQEGSRGSVALNSPVNGARSNMNAYLLDGSYNTDRNTFAVAVIPPLEAVQEFRTESSLAPSAFAQTGGGVVNLVTKSGSKQFHGNAFEYLRNGITDARNYFDDATLESPAYRRNQYGASLGGPLPRSTFFFFTYEGLRDFFTKPSAQIVPDPTLRQGNFGSETIYDPLSANAAGARTPFPNNTIPSDRTDPIAKAYLSRFEPLPNRANSSSNYLDTTPSTDHHDSASGRVDHQFAHAGLLFGRYTIDDDRGSLGGSFPVLPSDENLRAQQLVLGHTATSSHLVNELRASFTRLRLLDLPKTAFRDNVAKDLGILDPPTDPFAFGVPYFVVSNFSTVTDDPALPQAQRDNIWNANEGLTLERGRHTLRFGGDWIYFQMNYRRSETARGQYDYTGSFTGNNAALGDPFADFLLGYPTQTIRTVGSSQAYLRQHSAATYAEDSWKATDALTLTLGWRYEYNSPYSEARNNFLNLDYSTLPAEPRLVPVAQSFQSNWKDFSPRMGLAYRLPGLFSRGGQTVFRAGYGIYYSPEIATEDYDLALNHLQNEINTADGNTTPVLTTRNGFPGAGAGGFPSYFGLDFHSPTPYVQQWNGGFQHELPKGVLIDVSYLGSKGTHLGLFRRFNTPLHTETGEDLGPRPGDLQSLRTFPDLGTLFQRQHIANSSYESLQIKAEKRMNRRLSFLFSYVWSKSIDDATSVIVGLYDSAGAQNENNLRSERGLSFFNVPRRISGGFTFNLPGVRQAQWLTCNWQLNGIVTLQDGTPLDPIYFGLDFANTGTPNRPNVVPGQKISLPASQRTPDHWFNTGAFADPQPFTFGDAGRDIIPGPGNEVIDLALGRRFSITENLTASFRGEVFNSLNHPNLGIPGPYPDFGALFGKILSSGDPRRVQFSARFDF